MKDKRKKKSVLDVVLDMMPVIGAVIGMAIGAIFVMLWGIHPATFFSELIKGAFGGKLEIGSTLNCAVPLLIAGTGTAIAFRAGANNIGQEGQLFVGGLAASTIALMMPSLPRALGIPAILVLSFVFGMAFAGIAVLFRLFKGVNELLITLLLNYIGSYLISAMVNGPFQSSTNVSFMYIVVSSLQLWSSLFSAISSGIPQWECGFVRRDFRLWRVRLQEIIRRYYSWRRC